MVRVYKRLPGSRSYVNYTTEMLQKALTDIRLKKLTLRDANKKYKIPLGTLCNKLHGKHTSTVGHPLALTTIEENAIVKHVETAASWGFPFDLFALRNLVQYYLSKSGKTIPQFKNNLPSSEWALAFLKRHPNLSLRTCQNIKRNRAAVSATIIQEFFQNLERTLDGIPPTHIFNYDETNLSDNPGTKKCLFKRGVKYPERVRDFSKSCISIMFCGSASGTMLPAYVIYKAENLWSTWTEGGPAKTRYGRSKSGWFDGCTFEDWFCSVFLPAAKKLPGRKVLLGDNLSSHFTNLVLQLCQENDIIFCCLPANSTHLVQPLDVGFYGPLKRYWRQILDEWKISSRRKSQSLSKEEFPKLLLKLYNKIYLDDSQISNNMVAGFDKCGIYPLRPERVLSRLPDYQPNVEENVIENRVSDAVIDLLKDLRGVGKEQATRCRKKKINVAPGKSINPDDLKSNEDRQQIVGEGSHEDMEEEPYDKDDEPGPSSLPKNLSDDDIEQEIIMEEDSDQDAQSCDEEDYQHIPLICQKFYLVKFQVKNLIKHYVGKLSANIDENPDNIEMEFLRMSHKVEYKFHWPQVPDRGEISKTELVKKLSDPIQDRRNTFRFQKSELKKYKNTLN